MLQEIKECIKNIPDVPFDEFYQEYVRASQDSIIQSDLEKAEHRFNSIEDVTSVLKGLNTLTEELKRSW